MIDVLALYIGYTVIVAGSVAATALIACLPIEYAWRRFGDIAALAKVLREAKRQGRSIFKERETSHDNQ